MKKIILDLCGGTGAWSRPYSAADYDVRNITLPDFDVETYTPPPGVYGILAAPPCTIFSKARTTAGENRDFNQAMSIVGACLKIIWACRAAGSLKFWALENPATGYLRHFLGHPVFEFQPVEFGDNWTKLTALWGYFHRPVKTHRMIGKRGLKKYGYVQYVNKFRSAAERSVTPPGFAKAFFKANP